MPQNRLVRRLRRAPGDDGFTLVELIVAMFVISFVLLGLMALQTSALVTSAQSRQRVQATAVANQTMEQLRALPWLTLSKGLSTNFASASGGDPNVSGGNFVPHVGDTLSETLVTSSSQVTTMPPLSGTGGTNKTTTVDPGGTGTEFVTRTYVTRSSVTDPDVLMLTVLTTWRANQSAHDKFVILRSQAYAPAGGCGDASNQPFLGACQALFSSSGGASAPSITVTGTDPAALPGVTTPTPVLPGSPYAVGTVTVGQTGVGVNSQQASSVDSTVQHARAVLAPVDPDDAELASGGTKLTNAASNDVGSSGAAPASPSDVSDSGSSSAVATSGGSLTLSLRAGTGASGTARASTSTSCRTGIPAGQPCGLGQLSGGSAASVTLGVGGTDFVASSVGAGGSSTAFGARFSGAAGSSSVGCTAVTGSGCTAAGASHSVGTTVVGAGPWAGATNGLVSVSGYTGSVLAQRGVSQPALAPTASRSATVQYWNGTGYTSLTVSANTEQTILTPSVTWTSGALTVSAEARITVTKAGTLVTALDPTGCTGEGCTLDADMGTLTASVTYTIADGVSQWRVTVATDLGSARASAAFKAAPSA